MTFRLAEFIRIVIVAILGACLLTSAHAQYYGGPILLRLNTATAPVNISAPVSIGTNGANTLTTTANINAGDSVFVQIMFFNGAGVKSVSSVSDGTNSYIKLVGANDGSGGSAWGQEVWWKANATAVGSGATITVSWTGGNPTNTTVNAATVTGLIAAPLDQNPAGVFNASTNTPTVPTGALAQSVELVLGFNGSFRASNSETNSGFTNVNHTGGANTGTQYMDYVITSTSSSVTDQPVWTGTAGEVFTMVASFK